MERIQFQITARSGDEQIIEQVFASAASKFGLIDTKATSRVQNTICNYSEELGGGFGLGSCNVDEVILVDFNPISGRTERFNSVVTFIREHLQRLFAGRISEADAKSYIQAQNTLGVSDAGREFVMRALEAKRDR